MTNIREDAVWAAYNRACSLTDTTIHNTLNKVHEFRKQTILANEFLTKDEKSEVIKFLNETHDNYKIHFNEGTKRICGCSEIYTAEWIGGSYEWDFKEKQLTRYGNQNVILKELENVESANRRWFEESKSHLTISNKWGVVVQCFGLTKNPSSGNYMLVMNEMEMDLRTYLKQSYNNLIWKERIQIAYNIINGIYSIHKENAIHRDLHSGNILELNQAFNISDLGFCGPVDKPLNSVYGNLPYIAPEVITVNGMRPKIVPGTPLEYKKLMEQCWDADSTKRPDAGTLRKDVKKIFLNFQNNQDESQKQIISNQRQQLSIYYSSNSIDSISKNYTSKTYQFENFPEPKNATEEEQEAFHSKPYSFNIPNNIDYFNNSSVEKNVNISKSNSVYKVFGKLEINSNYNIQNNDYEKETVQQTKKHNLDINDKSKTI
ncbi:kinase-like domain-containing protein [Rhizophagus irregularis DAOM 181602=DAOM 197198]|nr:kinase-like domain-containing protein [Rhizophagus irregularis DAOM 181602=DAOM 197198]